MSELQKVFTLAAEQQNLVLDLKDLRLVDQNAVRFLADWETGGATFAELSCLYSGMDWRCPDGQRIHSRVSLPGSSLSRFSRFREFPSLRERKTGASRSGSAT